MKIKVTYTLQKEESVVVDIVDEYLIEKFKELGEVKTDEDFISGDPRWDIEKIAYENYSSGEGCEYSEYEEIVNRSMVEMEKFNESEDHE